MHQRRGLHDSQKLFIEEKRMADHCEIHQWGYLCVTCICMGCDVSDLLVVVIHKRDTRTAGDR